MMDEDRTDDGVGDHPAYEAGQRPLRPLGPVVYDADPRSSARQRMEGPFHVHAGGDPGHVAVAHRGAGLVDIHLGHPPDRIAEGAKIPARRHLDTSGAEAALLVESHPAVVGEDFRPALYVGAGPKTARHSPLDVDLVYRVHGGHAPRTGRAMPISGGWGRTRRRAR